MADSRAAREGSKRRRYFKTCAGIAGTFCGDNGYIRRRVGEKVQPIEIAGKAPNFAGNESDEPR
jgi:hypothetical protein